jgi:hypothetical protein
MLSNLDLVHPILLPNASTDSPRKKEKKEGRKRER